MTVLNNRPAVLELIGNTPLIEVSRIDSGRCQLFLKLEPQNPGGSIKNRIGLWMIKTAERDGQIHPGDTLIEATAGNTGLGLALVARTKGYQVIIVVPNKMSAEKVLHLKAPGANVHITRSDVEKGHPEYYQDYAARLARQTPGSFYVDQFNNPANPAAHQYSTAPEIWAQMGHDLDAIVCGVGYGGTLTGLTRFFRGIDTKVRFVLADPTGSILAGYVNSGQIGAAGSWAVEGIGEDFIPAMTDFSAVNQSYAISDSESFATARELLRSEGIPGGSSTGMLLAAALRYCRAQQSPQRVVTFVCDTGTRYLSRVYNDGWLIDQGLLQRPQYGNLRDIIARRFEEGMVVQANPGDSLKTVFQRMRCADVAQIPVIEDQQIVGIIDESDILLRVQADIDHFNQSAASAMTQQLETLPPDASIQALRQTIDRGLIAVIAEGHTFYGLITRFDLLNHLRRTIT